MEKKLKLYFFGGPGTLKSTISNVIAAKYDLHQIHLDDISYQHRVKRPEAVR